MTGAILVLEDGRTFPGEAYGARGEAYGEAVFTTAMTGYQEALTDPACHRQVVVQTAPHLGNTGVHGDDDESDRIWAAGYVVRDPTRVASHWRASGELAERLVTEGVVGIAGVDTRALTRHLRSHGPLRAGISSGDLDPARLRERVLASPAPSDEDLTGEVTTAAPYTVAAEGAHRYTLAALDLGVTRSVLHQLAARGVTTQVWPATADLAELLAAGPDAVLLSSGPGDPATADRPVALAREVLGRRVPLCGVGLGAQVLGRALGLPTYRLPPGHRGVNLPVQDLVTGEVEVAGHYHGFAVEAPRDAAVDTEFGTVEVTHVCLSDQVVEGLRCRETPAFGVQHRPVATAGHGVDYLFDRVVALLERG